MSSRATGSQPSNMAMTGVLLGLAIVGMMLILAFSIIAGYSVGKELQLQEIASAGKTTSSKASDRSEWMR